MNGTILPNPDQWVNLDHWTIDQIRALWTRSKAPPAMGYVWAYLQWRRANLFALLDAASEIDRLEMEEPAVRRILTEMVRRGIEFDHPTPHRPIKINRFGEVKVL